MSEQIEAEKYIKCSKCRCKYLNDNEHIKTNFGYNRLHERFKCCVKCRNKWLGITSNIQTQDLSCGVSDYPEQKFFDVKC